MNIENERQRQKELYEYVSTMHMLCLLILMSVLALNEDMFIKGIYLSISPHFLLFQSLVVFVAVLLYNAKNLSLSRDRVSLSWVDLTYMAFPLFVAVLALFEAGGNLAYVEAVLLLPVLIVASIMGKPAGLIMATVCAGFLVVYRMFFLLEGPFLKVLESGLILIALLYVVGWFIGSLTDVERRHRGHLYDLIELKRLVAAISANFINLGLDKIDSGISRALRMVGEFAGADRSYIFLFSDDRTKVNNIHTWCVEGIELQVGNLEGLAAEAFPWWMEKLNRFENINIPRVADLPSEARTEKEILQDHGIQSFVAVPMVYGKSLLGFLALSTVRTERVWPEESIVLLRMIGEIFVNAMARKRVEGALKDSEERHRQIVETANEGIWIVDAANRITFANKKMAEMLGCTVKELMGRSVFEFTNEECRKVAGDNTERRRQDMVEQYDFKLCRKDGRDLWVIVSATPLFDRNGYYEGTLEMLVDITERKQMEEQMRYLNLHDPLTGLYSRTYFEQEIRRFEAGRYNPIGLIMCDVDGLKIVNDTLGHGAGDDMLVAAAGILRKCFRECDMVARIGGDEFAVLLLNSPRPVVENACHRIRDAVARYNTDAPGLPLSMSVGYAVRSGTSGSMSDLFKEADDNMYREKLHHSRSNRSAVVQTLMKALEARDFVTEGHVDRLENLVVGLAMAIDLPESKIADLRLLSRFHDIGKVGIPDRILFKPGPLTSEEITEMRRHCEIGHRIAQSSVDLMPIADWILKHHEWWNGQGYPFALKGEEIPLECRILGIVDAYDAMVNDRPYRKAMCHEEAVAELMRCSGTQFDPQLVLKFVQVVLKSRNPVSSP